MAKHFYFFIFFITIKSFSQIDTASVDREFSIAENLLKNGECINSIYKFTNLSNIYYQNSKWNNYLSSQQMIAENYSLLGDFDKAQKITEDALVLSKTKYKTVIIEQGDLNNTLGFIYLNKGRDDFAMDKFQESLKIYKSFLPEINSQSAKCFSNLGLLYYNKGDKEMALEYNNKALNIRQKLFGDKSEQIADSYNNIGLLFSDNNTDEAIKYFLSALDIYKKIYKENNPKIANVYNNIAFIYLARKEYENALTNLNKVLTIRKTIYKDNHPNIAFVYSSIGRVYEEEGLLTEAMKYQKMALDIYKQNYGDKHFQIAATENFIGNIYQKQKKFTEALISFQRALCANHTTFNSNNIYQNPNAQKYYKAMVMLNSLLSKARTLEERYSLKTLKKQELQLSLFTLKTCDTLINIVRKITINKSDKLALGTIAAEVYEEGIRISMLLADVSISRDKYFKQAFYFSEKSKAAVMLESISDVKAKKFANIPDSLLLKEKQLKTDISFYEQKLTESQNKTQEEDYRNKIFSLNRDYDDFIKRLEIDFHQYYSLKFDINVTNVPSLQKVLDDKTALISYFTADINKRIYIFYLTKNEFKVFDVEKNQNMERYISGLNNSIKADSKEIFTSTSYQLYKLLFANTINKSIKNLIIIPDGRLGLLPFEVLINKKKPNPYSHLPYLIRKYAISYDYSATLIYQKNLIHAGKIEQTKLLAVAPVNFNNLDPLPASKDEVEEIAEMVVQNKGKADVAINTFAKKDLLESKNLKKYNLLHFATHGVVNEDNPELSQIYFSGNNFSDGSSSLFAGEIYNLEINADLVTLSACKTALGKIFKGEGLIGLSRAWSFAGGRNVLVSFWSVNDYSTSRLMKDFYSSYLQNNFSNNFSEALKMAKINMINSENYSKPYYWAPFILIGK